MDSDELIDEMLFCSRGTAEKQRYDGTAGDSLPSPDAWSGETHELTGHKAPDGVQNYRKRLASVAAGVKQGGMGYLLTEKH